MPGRDVIGSMEDLSPNFALFRSHKALPRSNTQPTDRKISGSTAQNPIQVHTVEVLSARSSERIRSWIQEPVPAQAPPDREVVLTPPLISLNLEDDHWIYGPALANYLSGSNRNGTGNDFITPVRQQSLPTPKTTPPRISRALVPSQALRDPSLRTGSFETARENPSSDGDETPIGSPLSHSVQQNGLSSSGKAVPKDVGLGLTLELSGDDEKPALTGTTPKSSPIADNLAPSSRPQQSARIEADNNDTGLEDEQPEKLSVQPKVGRTRPRVSTQPMPRPEKADKGVGSPVAGSQSLRQRLGRSQHHPSVSMEKFAAEIDWPLNDGELDLEARLREMDSRRFSQISGTSTVVEAMVIDSKPRRKQTLRHIGKVSDFRSESPRVSLSSSNLITSDNLSRRRLPRNPSSPDRARRRSVATDTSGSAASMLAKAQQGGVHVTPKQRPTTAPQETLGYFDIPPREPRSIPAVADTWTSRPGQPVLNDHSSDVKQAPLSATPANEEPSEIVTAPSTNSVTLVGQPQAILHLSDPSDIHGVNLDIHGVNLDRARSGEWSTLRPRSALFTPFSLRSAHSSTPGTLEVNEATAISIYPHTNKSILVIQEMPGNGSSETSAIIAGNANIALPVPPPPVVVEHSTPRPHSPLQNPREPPKPPDLNIIPPTPSNGPRTPDADLQPSQSSPKKRLSGTISVMRRALSTHRYSVPSVLPRTQSLGRHNSVPGRYRFAGGSARDHNLHPFWRPRGFWDGLVDDSDSDSEFGNSGSLMGAPVHTASRAQLDGSMPLRMPVTRQLSRSASLSRRLAGSFGLNKDGNQQPRLGTEQWPRTPTGDSNSHDDAPTYRMPKSARLGRSHSVDTMPFYGSRLPFFNFRALAQKMEKALNQREEGKREKVRERLRGSIDVIRGDDMRAPGSF